MGQNSRTDTLPLHFVFIGVGIFTTRSFKCGDFLLEYAGELFDKKEGEKRFVEYAAELGSFLYFFKHKQGGKMCTFW